eukprot:12137342-Alexandrium_andersonii.AAC.1
MVCAGVAGWCVATISARAALRLVGRCLWLQWDMHCSETGAGPPVNAEGVCRVWAKSGDHVCET